MSVNRMCIRSICGRYCRRAKKITGQESGLALPIVLGVLALGALITAPFLTHASTNLIGSAVYQQSERETCSADAGIEHAIWSLTDSNLASQIPAVGNTTGYALPNQVNALSPAITVTKISGGSGGGGAAGTITKSIISSLQFDTNGNNPVMVNVSSGVYALVYRDASNRVILKTLGISTGGIISSPVIDSQIIDNTGYEPDIVNISSGVYAVVYRGSSNKGYIATVQIAANGAIGNSLIDRVIYNSSNAYEPCIIHLTGSYYLVAYRGSSNKGYVSSLQISTAGLVMATDVSVVVFASTCYEPDLAHVSGNYYVIAYRGASNRGYLATLSVDTNGIITNSVISSLIFNNSAGYTPKILNISGNTWAVAYRGPTSCGYITTETISSAGIISSPVIDTFKFDGSAGYEPSFLFVSDGVYAIAYRGSSSNGFLKTISIAADGMIDQTVIDTFEFDASNGYEPWIIPVSGSIYAVAYRGGTGTTGYVKTIQIATNSVDTYQIQSTAGGTTVTASVTLENGISWLTSWAVTR
jgi:hypothetical protein